MLSAKFKGLRDGRPITVGWMNGRSRPYEVTMPYAAPRTALAIGFNDKCDVVVATVVATDVPAAERAALAFLDERHDGMDVLREYIKYASPFLSIPLTPPVAANPELDCIAITN